MTRPFMRLGITELENRFIAAGTDAKKLKALADELQHRNVPRAVSLLETVREVLASISPLSTTDTRESKVSSQLDLLGGESIVEAESTSRTSHTASMEGTSEPAPSAEKTVTPRPVSETVPLPQLSLEDACRILKVTATDPWEDIEKRRRELIRKSHPDATRSLADAALRQVREEAKQVNDAAIVIAARRCGRQ